MLALQHKRQPGQYFPIDWANPITTGLAFAWSAHAPNTSGFRVAASTSGHGHALLPQGRAMYFTAADSGVNFGSQNPILQTTGITVLAYCAPVSEAQTKIAFSQRVQDGGLQFCQVTLGFNMDLGGSTTADNITLLTRNTAAENRASWIFSGAGMDGTAHVWVLGIDSSLGGFGDRDGVPIASHSSASLSGTWTDVTQKTRVGNFGDYSADNTYVFDDPIGHVLVWNRLLRTDERKSIAQNQWQVYQPLDQVIYAFTPTPPPPPAPEVLRVTTQPSLEWERWNTWMR